MTFRECCVFGLLLLRLNDSTCLNGLFSEFRRKVTKKSERGMMKYQAIKNYIYQRLSQPKINLDSINFYVYSEIIFLRWDIILSKKKTSLRQIRQMPYNFSFDKKVLPRSKK